MGYGVLDGSPVPEKFVRKFKFSLTHTHTIELVSDGYFSVFPAEATIDACEKLHDHIEEVDPHKIGEFASTKTTDDRTVIIIELKHE